MLTEVQIVTQLPAFPTILGALANVFFLFIPLSVVAWFARVILKTPAHTAQAAAEFLKGPHAVRQAMHLLRDECREIKEDKWTEAVWGSSESTNSMPIQLKLYFAKDVSTSCRWPPNLLNYTGRVGV